MGNRAPGALGLVQEFVNTLDVEKADERLGTPEALGEWLRDHGLFPGGPVTGGEHAAAIGLREALRRLTAANNGAPLRDADLAVLNDLVAACRLRPRFEPGSTVRLEPDTGGVPGALGRVAAAVAEAMTEGTWHRLKSCAETGCQWAFYDQSKNRSGHWCSMEVCGNRAKARQFRERRRATGRG
jgi:predicted RNA-binding Zn ribbon-like protein